MVNEKNGVQECYGICYTMIIFNLDETVFSLYKQYIIGL